MAKRREEWEGCTVDWESDEDDWDDTPCIGTAAQISQAEKKVNAKMRKRMAGYVKGDRSQNKAGSFDYSEDD